MQKYSILLITNSSFKYLFTLQLTKIFDDVLLNELFKTLYQLKTLYLNISVEYIDFHCYTYIFSKKKINLNVNFKIDVVLDIQISD